MPKTESLELVVDNARSLYSDVGADGKPLEGRKRLYLLAAQGVDPQTVCILTANPDFLAAPHGTPVTVTFTLGSLPAPADAPAPAPEQEHA